MAWRTQARPAAGAARLIGCLTVLSLSCAAPKTMKPSPAQPPQPALDALQSVKTQFAPDSHLAVFDVKLCQDGENLILQGEVDNPVGKEAALAAVKAAGFHVSDRITVLPQADFGERVWGLANLSLVNLREKPGNASEMGTQAFMGSVLRVWKTETNWFLVQTADHYLGWTEGGAFTACTREEAATWQAAPLLIVTALDERILEEPSGDAAPVSDVVQCDLVKLVGTRVDWFKVALPDGRSGYLPQHAAEDYSQWKQRRHPTPENIERTAQSLIGRPYFWGCNSVRGMDCSGFTKLVYFLNGIDLDRNTSQQCRQGIEVPLDDDLKNLKKGDLLFFGRPDRRTGAEKITHVGIYLEDKRFIQSSVMVHISSLDPTSPLSDRRRIRSLLHARRVLPEP
jgi:uncharacterized protein YgiM (DUF1202 family)